MLTTIRIHIVLQDPEDLGKLRTDLIILTEKYKFGDTKASLAIDHTEDFR